MKRLVQTRLNSALVSVQVIAEDVAAVVLHYGTAPRPAKPLRELPAFPQAATSNHEANEEDLLHETREFWARLQPESLLPLLQTVSASVIITTQHVDHHNSG